MNYINIKLPATGFIIFPNKFKKILDSKEFQRLRRIKQLSGAEYVFPGATHTRFEHSIGVFSNVQKMILSFKNKGIDISDNLRETALLAGLLHDIGHGPFSHNFEDILLSNVKKDHEDFTNEIIKKSVIGDYIEDLGLKKDNVADLAVGRLNLDKNQFLDHMIAGAIDCDQMDYLVRDPYHCGTNSNYEMMQRLINIANVTPEGNLAFDIKGIPTIEAFLFTRLNSFRTIYFHKTSRAIQLMLGRAMLKYNEESNAFKFNVLDNYLQWDDYSLYNTLKNNESTKKYIDRIEKRDIIKLAYEKPSELNKTEEELKPYNPEKVREAIANKAKVDKENIFIDFPKMRNVPYQHSSSLITEDIYVYAKKRDRKIESEKIEKYSLFLEQMRGYFRLVRVYTEKKYIEQVANASKKILVGITLDEFW
ncbi:MAG: HD domain-containing protein [Promethearchaeota archaeon]